MGILLLLAGMVLVGSGLNGNEILAKCPELGKGSDLPMGGAFMGGAIILLLLSLEVSTRVSSALTSKIDATSQYQDLGHWARHFSTVRMTVATFLTGLVGAVVLVAIESDVGSPKRIVALQMATGLLAVMVGMFVLFTRLTYLRMDKQRRLLDSGDKCHYCWGTDPALWVVLVVGVGSAIAIWTYVVTLK
jgi:hypothetical protein